jgi:hypothetical protein
MKNQMMKNLVKYFFGVVIVILMAQAPLQADNSVYDGSTTLSDVALAETSDLMQRVEFIRDMDKSDLNSSERKELRKELKAINKEIKQRGPYLYISGGALLLIVLLILFL